MEQEYKYKSAPPIAKYKKLKSGAVEMLIRHNLRMKIPENVIQENMKYNFYFFNGIKEKIDNEKAYLLTNEKHFELINTLEKDWNDQQKDYSLKQKQDFHTHCEKHNTYLEVILNGTRQEWFEKMNICKFTNEFVDDKFTSTRKMGKLIVESINYEKLNEWVTTEINFMKQWMKKNLQTDIGYLYSAVHIDETTPHIHFGFIPIAKVYSKVLAKERYKLSTNLMFGDRKSLQRFNNYHANYLTKAGFEIEPGIVGSTGSYGGVGYKEVKEIENQKLQYKISMMHNEYRKKHETQYNSFKKLSLKYEDIESEIKAYLKMSNKFNDAEINKLSTFLSLTQKMQYFDLTAQWQPTKENIKTANDCKSQYKNILKIIEPLRQKGQQFLNEVDKNYEMG